MSRTRGADDPAVTDSPDEPGDARSAKAPAADVTGATSPADVAGPAGPASPAGVPGTAARGAAPGAPPDAPQPRTAPATGVVVAVVTAVIALPIVVAAIAVRTPRWYPLVDLAQIEMRVRDVGSADPPLVGPIGRFFGYDTQGFHPGPLSFWLLAPVYRLLGASSWALQVSAATLNVAALAATVWAGHRRWGLRGALLVGAGLAVLMRAYGTVTLVYPWNPYMCVLFWALFLVCAWGVLCGDLPLLPVAVVAGTLCTQTHIAYVTLVGGVGLLVAGSLVLAHRRARGDRAARRRLVQWTVAAAALGTLLWAPVVAEQISADPGNVSIVVDSFRHPTDEPVGVTDAWRLLTQHLDVVALLAGDRGDAAASSAVGVALLVAWAVAALVAVRRGDRTLVRLHAVVAAALVLGFLSISRILGVPWFYLTLWALGTATLALVATVATVAPAVATAVTARWGGGRPDAFARVPYAALAVALLVPTSLLALDAPGTEDVDADVSDRLAQVVEPTVDAIEEGTVAGGAEGTYLVTWDDQTNLGGQGFGLMLELERRGYRVRAREEQRLGVRDHRVADPAECDAEIHLASGDAAIERARDRPGAREIARHDERTPAQLARYERLRTQVIETLRARSLDDLVPRVDQSLFGLGNDDRLPADLGPPVAAMAGLPQPVAVFTWELTP